MSDFWSNISPQLAQSIGVVATTLLAWWVIARIGRRAAARVDPLEPERQQRVATLWQAGRRVITILLGVIVLLMLLSIWDVPITPLLAVGSAVGLAVGFGAQDSVKDLIAGFLILAEGQFDIGDTVTVAGVSGTVTDIRLRVTVLRDLNGAVHFVPNGQISVASNLTKEFSRAVVDVGVAYDSDIPKVKALLEDEIRAIEAEFPDLFAEPGEVQGVNELAGSAIVVRAILVTQADARWQVKRIALERIAERFRSENIVIPFQTVNVVKMGDSGA